MGNVRAFRNLHVNGRRICAEIGRENFQGLQNIYCWITFEVSHPRCVLFNINITMYELVRTQLYLNMVHGVVIYYQLHVSASILAIITT